MKFAYPILSMFFYLGTVAFAWLHSIIGIAFVFVSYIVFTLINYAQVTKHLKDVTKSL
jgi:hypothetical protein